MMNGVESGACRPDIEVTTLAFSGALTYCSCIEMFAATNYIAFKIFYLLQK